jgi:hypothetical protein
MNPCHVCCLSFAGGGASVVYQQPPSPSRLDESLLSYSTIYPPPSRRSQPLEVRCPKTRLTTPLSASWSHLRNLLTSRAKHSP